MKVHQPLPELLAHPLHSNIGANSPHPRHNFHSHRLKFYLLKPSPSSTDRRVHLQLPLTAIRARLEARLKCSFNARNEGRVHGHELLSRPDPTNLVGRIKGKGRHKQHAEGWNRDSWFVNPPRSRKPPPYRADERQAVGYSAPMTKPNCVPGFDIGEPPPPSKPAPDRSLINTPELVADLTRFAEGLLEEKHVRRKYRFAESTWEALSTDEKFIEAIELERIRRVRDGSFKRERSQAHITRAPDVLAGIMDDPQANARHRVDSIKVLNAIADPGPEAAANTAERFVIQINMGSNQDPQNTLRFEAEVPPKPNPIDSWETFKLENAPPRKRDDDGGNNF